MANRLLIKEYIRNHVDRAFTTEDSQNHVPELPLSGHMTSSCRAAAHLWPHMYNHMPRCAPRAATPISAVNLHDLCQPRLHVTLRKSGVQWRPCIDHSSTVVRHTRLSESVQIKVFRF